MPTALEKPDVPQRIVLNGVSWEYYEQTLKEIGNQPIRVSYLDGMMELMSPLPKHEGLASAIGDLVKALTEELDIPRKAYRSTTFRLEPKAAGSEPDECFYFHETDSVTGMEQFNPSVHRAPDLWIEVDLFSSSVAREVIYARLGVPEIWRYSGDRLIVRLLTPQGVYVDCANQPRISVSSDRRVFPVRRKDDPKQQRDAHTARVPGMGPPPAEMMVAQVLVSLIMRAAAWPSCFRLSASSLDPQFLAQSGGPGRRFRRSEISGCFSLRRECRAGLFHCASARSPA